jgi:hypothetical protein
MTSSASLDRRLEQIRGGAQRRSPTVRVLAAYAQHTDCRLATLGFAAGVNFDRLLVGTRFQMPFGQSPFAIGRGLAFEKMLRHDNYAATLGLLRPVLALPPAGVRIVNLREGYTAGPDRMPHRARDTSALLGRVLAGDSSAPHLIDGAVLRASVGGLAAYFEADALAALAGDQVRVAEVKSFPKVDERVDPDKLAAALDQVAIYILFTREEVARLGFDSERYVSDRALLITPRNVGLTPTLSEQRVESRVRRARRLLDAVPRAADVAAAAPAGASLGPIADTRANEARRIDLLHDLADRVGTAYEPSCLSNCGNARFCRTRAFRDGSPCLSGTGALRLLPGVLTLGRAEELTRGGAPTLGEEATAELLGRAGRLYDEATAGTGPATPTPARRLA